MRSFVSTSKVIRRLVTHRNVCKQRVGIENHVQVRCLSGIVGVPSVSPGCDVGSKVIKPLSSSSALGEVCNIGNSIQSRGFLGCGDGEEGNMLTKIHEEKCVVGYSPEQLYAVVAAVDLYEDFLPWCQRSEILRSHPDGSFDAELEIGFKFLVESYVSHVELNKPKYIKTTATDSGLFEHLINIWEFNPGPTPGSCNLHFLVDFKFHSPLYRQVANMFFKEVVSKLVGSFRDRCRLIYGPGVPIHEDTYQQRL
ncbi:coenzyme Q-binding protein COQ10, mitochondrial isoform X1 [Capsicum galapagoense]